MTASYCLVLGGGGAKGVYHIGVWQALKKLDIPVNAFIGNSIGAVMAAFLAQGAEQELLEIARSINLSSLIRLNEDEAMADENSLSTHTLNYWQGVYKNVVQRRGLDTSPMRNILEAALSEEKLRASGVDFGITTVNVSDFEPREVFIDQMEPGQLINYVMASAAFPGFQRPVIEGKRYVDGGLYSNVPYAMAKRRGYRKIILVDISGIGVNRRPKTEGTETIFIKNSIDMGNAFEFDPEFIQKFWRLGYLDTLRTFGKLVGYQYFLEPNETLEQACLQQQLITDTHQKLVDDYPDNMRHDRRIMFKTLEVCADMLGIERVEQYSYHSLAKAIDQELAATRQRVDGLLANRGLSSDTPSHKWLDAVIREYFDEDDFANTPYYISYLLDQVQDSRTGRLARTTQQKLSPEIAIVEFYITHLQSLLSVA